MNADAFLLKNECWCISAQKWMLTHFCSKMNADAFLLKNECWCISAQKRMLLHFCSKINAAAFLLKNECWCISAQMTLNKSERDANISSKSSTTSGDVVSQSMYCQIDVFGWHLRVLLLSNWRETMVTIATIGNPERHVRKASYCGSKQQ